PGRDRRRQPDLVGATNALGRTTAESSSTVPWYASWRFKAAYAAHIAAGSYQIGPGDPSHGLAGMTVIKEAASDLRCFCSALFDSRYTPARLRAVEITDKLISERAT